VGTGRMDVSHSLSSPWPGSIPSCGGIFEGIFPLGDDILPTRLEPVWQKMAQSPFNDTTKPVVVEANHGQIMAKRIN